MNISPRILVTTILAAGLALAPTQVRSAGKDPVRCEDDDQRGGEINGTLVMESDVTLAFNPDAPAEPNTPGASGKAFLQAYNDNGQTTATLDLEMFGLAQGDYVVTVTSLADGITSTPLGTFSVAPEDEDPTLENDDDSTDNDDLEVEAAGVKSGKQTRGHGSEGEDESNEDDDNGGGSTDEDQGPYIGEDTFIHFGGEGGIAFPEGFNPLDIGVITVAMAPTVDAEGNEVPGIVVLSGDFAIPDDGDYNATVEVESGDGTTAVYGKALVRAKVRHSKVRAQRFALAAKGLPPNAKVVVSFNGGRSMKAQTSRKGTLGIRRLPQGQRAHIIHTVTISSSKTGEAIARARF